MSVVIGADPAPETYPNEVEHRALIARHSRSVGEAVKGLINIVWAGTVTTTPNQNFTYAVAEGVLASDVVLFSAINGTAGSFVAGYDGGSVSAATGSNGIVISHVSFGGSGTFSVVVVRP